MIALIAASAVLLAAPASPGLRIEGSFIQYSDWMMKQTRAEWRRELDAARAAGMRTIIIQWLALGDRDYMNAPAAEDATRIILEYADRHGMHVYLGLASDDAWWKRWGERDYLDSAARKCEATAERAWKRYGAHRSMAGWYIPHELWDAPFTADQVALLRGFYRRISDRCKRLSAGKPVATAPFFSGLTPPARVADLYADLLTSSGLDIVMLQDGVGARGWDGEVETRVTPYFSAFRDACVRAGVELWSDLECFRLKSGQGGGFEPAAPGRVLEQLAAAAPFVRRFVTFDFFHYMSPSRGDAARALYQGYRKACVDTAFLPNLGRSMQVDPVFGYYKERSPDSIAEEIRAAGYSVVQYVVVNDDEVSAELVNAFRRRGIGVWHLTFANGTYRVAGLPKGWEAWKMVTRSDLAGEPLNDGYTRLCLNNPDYRRWKKARMAAILKANEVLGVQIAEPHWPEYPGPTAPAYACFCDHCKAAFRRMHPEESSLPEIIDPASPRHPDRNPNLWRKWLRFRQETLTDFLDDLVNGPGGLRETSRDRKVCTWSLALLGDGGVERVRELHGEDAGEIVKRVKPDVHCLQTHWPDWIRCELAGDYITGYKPFLDQIRATSPDLPVLFQADTGSQKQNRRSWDWIRLFEKTCGKLGAQGGMSYEYFIGGYMYDDPPRVVEAERDGDRVRLLFTKRLDPKTAGDPAGYAVDIGRVAQATVDGSTATLVLTGVGRDRSITITLKGIADAAERRLFNDKPPCVLTEQIVRPVTPAARP